MKKKKIVIVCYLPKCKLSVDRRVYQPEDRVVWRIYLALLHVAAHRSMHSHVRTVQQVHKHAKIILHVGVKHPFFVTVCIDIDPLLPYHIVWIARTLLLHARVKTGRPRHVRPDGGPQLGYLPILCKVPVWQRQTQQPFHLQGVETVPGQELWLSMGAVSKHSWIQRPWPCPGFASF